MVEVARPSAVKPRFMDQYTQLCIFFEKGPTALREMFITVKNYAFLDVTFSIPKTFENKKNLNVLHILHDGGMISLADNGITLCISGEKLKVYRLGNYKGQTDLLTAIRVDGKFGAENVRVYISKFSYPYNPSNQDVRRDDMDLLNKLGYAMRLNPLDAKIFRPQNTQITQIVSETSPIPIISNGGMESAISQVTNLQPQHVVKTTIETIDGMLKGVEYDDVCAENHDDYILMDALTSNFDACFDVIGNFIVDDDDEVAEVKCSLLEQVKREITIRESEIMGYIRANQTRIQPTYMWINAARSSAFLGVRIKLIAVVPLPSDNSYPMNSVFLSVAGDDLVDINNAPPSEFRSARSLII